MRAQNIQPTGREAFFAENEIIVSKTDPRGIITYANDVFQRVSGFSEAELLGQPHNASATPACRGASSSCCGTRSSAELRFSLTL